MSAILSTHPAITLDAKVIGTNQHFLALSPSSEPINEIFLRRPEEMEAHETAAELEMRTILTLRFSNGRSI